MKTNTRSVLVAMLSLVMAACGGEALVTEEETGEVRQGMTWEEFLTHIYFEPESGVYIVDGDTPVENEKKLREFYELNVKQGQLIVHQNGSVDARWNDTQKLNLTYCVSHNFGTRYNTVVEAMAQATGAWMAAANVKFVHKSDQDATCTSSNSNVLFDVNPVNVNGEYLARAFFPDQSRSTRNVLIDSTAFSTSGNPNLGGILRHELGHSLGFRHEHTRPESGTCFEDNNWRALTTYDSDSVMHYPQCNGTGDWTLTLTARDISGASSLYGNAGSSQPADPTPTEPTEPTEPTPTTGDRTTENFNATVAKGKAVYYGPFEVEPSSLFEVVMSGTGDPDLYVRFGAKPTTTTYDCRPYKTGAAESCSVNVPAGKTTAYLMIRGYSASTFQLAVSYTAKVVASSGGTPASSPMTAVFGGSLTRGELRNHGPLPVVAGSTFRVVMTGTGDADLYVKFGAQATQSNFDCRPYLDGSAETCTITVPAGASQAYLMVHGYVASTYSLDVAYVAP